MPAQPAPSPLAKRRPDVPVEVLATRTLSLATLGPRWRAERRRESIATLEALAGGSLDELRQKLPTRYWVVGMLSLMGKSTREIADLVGYAGSAPVVRVLRHPAVGRLIEAVREAQLERVLSGTYGVAAAARAAAPAVIEHVAALAGGAVASMRPTLSYEPVARSVVRRRRSTRIRMTWRAKEGVSETMNSKRLSSIGISVQSVFAMAVALRGALSIMAISPTRVPGDTDSKVSPPR